MLGPGDRRSQACAGKSALALFYTQSSRINELLDCVLSKSRTLMREPEKESRRSWQRPGSKRAFLSTPLNQVLLEVTQHSKEEEQLFHRKRKFGVSLPVSKWFPKCLFSSILFRDTCVYLTNAQALSSLVGDRLWRGNRYWPWRLEVTWAGAAQGWGTGRRDSGPPDMAATRGGLVPMRPGTPCFPSDSALSNRLALLSPLKFNLTNPMVLGTKRESNCDLLNYSYLSEGRLRLRCSVLFITIYKYLLSMQHIFSPKRKNITNKQTKLQILCEHNPAK